MTSLTQFIARSGRARLMLMTAAVSFGCSIDAFGFTKSNGVYTTDGSQSDVSAALADATAGNTINVPPGTFTWGANGSFVAINAPVTLSGAGTGSTIITLSSTGPSATSGTIRLAAAAVVKGFTIQTPTSGNPTAFSISASANGFRITNVTYDNSRDHGGYYIYTEAYGLIDSSNIISGGGGTQETIFARGPANSWQTPNSLGTGGALYVEDCTFGGGGYVCDINDNGRAVFRFNTINGANKIDAHGYASNSLRGVRQMEVYGNRWTAASGFWWAIELRGGTGMVFDNVSVNGTAAQVEMELKEYGCVGQWPNFNNAYQTPVNYALTDQIGVGQDPKVGGSEPYYLWSNTKAGSAWTLNWTAPANGAISVYQTQVSNSTATFTMQDIVKADRDYFIQGATFDGSTGVGRGTKAQMLAIVPTKKGVGYWVTDEGQWNASHAGADGQLYSWNGSSWTLKYTPYAYPHPLRTGTAGNLPLNVRTGIGPTR